MDSFNNVNIRAYEPDYKKDIEERRNKRRKGSDTKVKEEPDKEKQLRRKGHKGKEERKDREGETTTWSIDC